MDSFGLSLKPRSLEKGCPAGTHLAEPEAARGGLVSPPMWWDYLCSEEWLPEKTHGSREVQTIFPLRKEDFRDSLSLLWTELPVDVGLSLIHI